jgi:TolB protein
MQKTLRSAAVVAAAAVVLAGCSSSTEHSAQRGTPATPTSPSATPAAQMAAHNVEAPIQDVPWSEVGPGWMLAMWNAATPMNSGDEFSPGDATPYNAETTLYLVNPEGSRYAITTFEAPGENGSLPTLADWSGDGTRALFYRQGDDLTVIEVDLRTGERTSFPVKNGYAVTPRYTRPEGKAVLLLKSNDVDSAASLTRVDLSGKQQLTYPVDKLGSEFNASYLSSPDGTRLVLGTDTGLARMGNDGTPGEELPVPEASSCTPTRWWETDVALARCYGTDFSYSQLWLVPIDGTAPTPLTGKNDGTQGQDMGDLNAWQLPEGTFVQAAGGCGFVYLAKLNSADGTTTPVSVPDVDDGHSVQVLGVADDHLQLQATLSCGSGESLVDYDPASGTSTVLLGEDVNGGGVVDAVPYPDSQ